MLAAQRWFIPLNLHPLVYGTSAYLLGIWWQATQDICPFILTLISLIVLSCCSDRRIFPTIALVFVGAYTLGALRLYHQQQTLDALYKKTDNRHYRGSGIITDIARHHHTFFKYRIAINLTTLTDIKTNELFTPPTATSIQVYVHDMHDIRVDDTICINDLHVKKPHAHEQKRYALRSWVIATLFGTSSSLEVLHRPTLSYARWIFDQREKLWNTLRTQLAPATRNLVGSIFLGNKAESSATKPSIISRFAVWGISHHLARSGLHLVIFVILWHVLLRMVPMPNRYRHLIIILLAMVYYLLSWPSLSFNRACLAFLLYKICTFQQIKIDAMHTIAWVTLFFLITTPAHLLCLDFQLSFGLTSILAWFNHTRTHYFMRQHHKSIATS